MSAAKKPKFVKGDLVMFHERVDPQSQTLFRKTDSVPAVLLILRVYRYEEESPVYKMIDERGRITFRYTSWVDTFYVSVHEALNV